MMIYVRFKTGRVVIMTAGRYAGKKAIVAQNYEDGTRVLVDDNFRNIDSLIYFWWVSVGTQDKSREASIRRNSSKRLV